MVLLIVDTQEMIMTEELYEFNTFVENVTRLISSARLSNTEIVYIRHDDGTELTTGMEGYQIFPPFAPKENDKIFDKHYNSSFRSTGLIEYLNSKKETQIMIAGIQTEYCIDATIKCGFEHGFTMIVPALCNTTACNDFMTGEQSYHYYNRKIWNKRYANCLSMEEALTLLAN